MTQERYAAIQSLINRVRSPEVRTEISRIIIDNENLPEKQLPGNLTQFLRLGSGASLVVEGTVRMPAHSGTSRRSESNERSHRYSVTSIAL